ncbi:MAG: glycoside hydrolase family 9 protein [Chitinispirillaceae bacterium]|nr:glycoside hydrolase family 9 protein [Chitinispirillaceae bacterium]
MSLLQQDFLKVSLTLLITVCSSSGDIHLNQIGYYPDDKKIAIAVGPQSDSFSIADAQTNSIVYTGGCVSGGTWDASEESTQVADFSSFEKPGSYRIKIKGHTDSSPFQIGDNIHNGVLKSAIKAYYFNRASIDLESAYAGKWSRTAGHRDTQVKVHSSAASKSRPSGSSFSSPGGWYDAGDYGKYIVNSGISTYTLLLAYTVFKDFYDTLTLNIPESSNSIPDLLDEIIWNLRWMLTMQDADGGVYHKLTTLQFSGDVMPAQDRATRYVFRKSTAATLDFAAVTAQASRILRTFESKLPGLADSCLQASRRAWAWARQNPGETFVNPQDVNTGQYGNEKLGDEFYWAGTELFISTREDSFYTIGKDIYKEGTFDLPGWPDVATLGNYSLLIERNNLTDVVKIDSIVTIIDTLANRYAQRYQTNPYRVTMAKKEFYWGSNAVAANQGMLLLIGFMVNGKSVYKDAAIGVLDYLLGRNPNAYCFVTGAGDRPVMNIHHRPSVADGVIEPVPGFLCGGPNAQQNEFPSCEEWNGCPEYPFPKGVKVAMSYVDQAESYASNEVAINWNAPFVFLCGGCEALQKTSFSGVRKPHHKSDGVMQPSVYFRRAGSFAIELPDGYNGSASMIDLRGKVLFRTNLTGNSFVTISSDRVRRTAVIVLDVQDAREKKRRFVYKILNAK